MLLNSQSCLQHWQRLFPVEKLKQLSLLKLNPLWHRGGNFFLHNSIKTRTDQRALVFQLVKITHFAFIFIMDFCHNAKFCVSACSCMVLFYTMSPHTFSVISQGLWCVSITINFPLNNHFFSLLYHKSAILTLAGWKCVFFLCLQHHLAFHLLNKSSLPSSWIFVSPLESKMQFQACSVLFEESKLWPLGLSGSLWGYLFDI